jgi:hypothetical protein
MSNLIRNYVKNTRIKKAKLEKELHADQEIINNKKDVIQELKKILDSGSSITKYHKNLRIFKDPSVNTKKDLDEIKNKYKDDKQLLNTLLKYEKQIQEGVKVLNYTCLQLDKELLSIKSVQSKFDYYNEQITEYTNSILAELHDVTVKEREDQKVKSTPPPKKVKTKKEKEKEQKISHTSLTQGSSLFTLFRTARGDNLKELFFSRKYDD